MLCSTLIISDNNKSRQLRVLDESEYKYWFKTHFLLIIPFLQNFIWKQFYD